MEVGECSRSGHCAVASETLSTVTSTVFATSSSGASKVELLGCVSMSS